VSSLLPKEERLEGLGFLTKAFGIWYFNIQKLYGMTQWSSSALRVHVNYGLFQLVTAYTPIHNFANTLTYLVDVDAKLWCHYVDDVENRSAKLKATNLWVDLKNEQTMIDLHRRIEKGEGPFYLNSDDQTSWAQGEKFRIFTRY
jgi:hypothetical protein